MPEYHSPSSFPVVLYDGQHEIDVGNVEVHPLIEFKKLSSILSDKIGIDPDRVTIAIMKSSPPRKMILHENKIFSHILQKDKDCYFLVSLKSPPRRGRRGGRNRPVHQEHQDCYFTSSSQIESLSKRLLSNPPQKVLLRRDSTAIPLQPCLAGLGSSYYDPISTQNLRLGYRDYASQLQIEKETYLMSMINSYPYEDFNDIYGYGRSTSGGGRAAVCDVCSNADGGTVPFHWCVYDATTVGFRSPAGPIARPSKG